MRHADKEVIDMTQSKTDITHGEFIDRFLTRTKLVNPERSPLSIAQKITPALNILRKEQGMEAVSEDWVEDAIVSCLKHLKESELYWNPYLDADTNLCSTGGVKAQIQRFKDGSYYLEILLDWTITDSYFDEG